jgi:cell division protein FtsN
MAPRYPGQPASEQDGVSLFRQPVTINLTLISLIGIGMVALIALSWAFAFGVIIGRGLEPEESVPILGRLTPQSASPSEEPIIKPEDLTFLSDLKSQPTLSTETPSPSLPRTGLTPTPDAPERPPAQTQATQGVQSLPAAAPTEKSPDPVDKKTYNFLFQVIAYKRAEQAEDFREKLEEAGLRTRLRIEKNRQGAPRIYQVQVLFKGTEEGAEQVKSILAAHGVKQPVISRNP